MRLGWTAGQSSARLKWLAIIAAVGLTAVYSYIYFVEPFDVFWNNLLSDGLSVFASLLSAIAATMVWAYYDKTDYPRKFWRYFAIGLWLWFVGESIWAYLNMTIVEVTVGPHDIFWIISYYFIGRTFLLQYQILRRPTTRALLGLAVAMLVLVFVLTLAVSVFLSGSSDTFETLINAFYPAADFVLVLSALWVTSSFQGGALGRPWIGLLIFCVSDLMNAWLQYSGIYAWSLDQGNLLSSISDIIYFAAYLVLALGAFSQWRFLKYGLRPVAETR